MARENLHSLSPLAWYLLVKLEKKWYFTDVLITRELKRMGNLSRFRKTNSRALKARSNRTHGNYIPKLEQLRRYRVLGPRMASKNKKPRESIRPCDSTAPAYAGTASILLCSSAASTSLCSSMAHGGTAVCTARASTDDDTKFSRNEA